MTTYLTKKIDGKIHHFKAAVDDHVVSIVEGKIYSWINKWSQGCGNNDNAIKKQKELVNEKLNEDYQISEYLETLENTLDVYDKAKWHFGGNFPTELYDFQGYVHTGMFLGWLVDKDLISEKFKSDHKNEIILFKRRELTGSQMYEQCCDGVLLLDDINELGNRFSLPYFNFDTGKYLEDYENTLSQNHSTLYHIQDTWENYYKLKLLLDKRFGDWNRTSEKKRFWKLW